MDNSKYNKIPVHYCKTCLSLKVLSLEKSNVDFCGTCGNTEISTASIQAWEEKYKEQYGRSYINT